MLISDEELERRRQALQASSGYKYPESQTPLQEIQRALVDQLSNGAALKPGRRLMAKPILLVTCKLREAIEARAARDYDARLNPQDASWATDRGDHIGIAAASARGIVVTNTPECSPSPRPNAPSRRCDFRMKLSSNSDSMNFAPMVVLPCF